LERQDGAARSIASHGAALDRDQGVFVALKDDDRSGSGGLARICSALTHRSRDHAGGGDLISQCAGDALGHEATIGDAGGVDA